MTRLAIVARLSGHFWTIARHVEHQVRPRTPPAETSWRCRVAGAGGHDVTLTGRLGRAPGAGVIAVIVHGLGGSHDSAYCVRAAWACHAMGWSTLRLALRGADGEGADIYHAGLATDLHAVFDDDAIAAHEHIVLWGYSLGGHVTLHVAADGHPRVRAAAAIGAPLHLARSCAAIDRRRVLPYRIHVINALKRAYREVAARRRTPIPTDPAEVDRIRTLWEWDDLVVVPRWGFGSVARYHASQSVGSRLRSLAMPALYVGARFDPMVPYETIEDALRGASPELDVHMTDFGGHVGFPDRIRLDPGDPNDHPSDHPNDRALETQVVAWLSRKIHPV